jgi:lipoic acid synthetase
VDTVLASGPDIFSHNLETVERLYPDVRFKSAYGTALDVLERAGRSSAVPFTKTGIMVGLGETWSEVLGLIAAAAATGIQIMTIGQYLRPTRRHRPIHRYYTPEEFDELGRIGRSAGIRWVFSGPLVRSSYHAEDVFQDMVTAGAGS